MKLISCLWLCCLVILFLLPARAGALIFLEDDFDDGTLTEQPEGRNWLPILPLDMGPEQMTAFEAYQTSADNWVMHIDREASSTFPISQAGAHVADTPLPAIGGTKYSVSTDFVYRDTPVLSDPDISIGVIGYGQNWVPSPTGPEASVSGDFYFGVVNPTRSNMIIGKSQAFLGNLPLAGSVFELPFPDLWQDARDNEFNLQMDIYEHTDGTVDIDLILRWMQEHPETAGEWVSHRAEAYMTDRPVTIPMSNQPGGQVLELLPLLGGGTAGVIGIGSSQSQQAMLGDSINGLFDNFAATSTVPEPSTIGLLLCALAAIAWRGRRG